MPQPAMSRSIAARLRAAGCVFAEDEARLLAAEAPDAEALEAMISRRVSGAPLEVVLGWAEFCGLRIPVEPGVFVPRRRTEFLAQQAILRLPEAAVVVELCCGSGAVSAAMLAAGPFGIEVHAVDIDSTAVSCARRHLEPAASVYQGDLYEPLPERLRGRVDIVVANAPYVPSSELNLLPREARQHEPQAALDGGVDGLEIARRVVAGSPLWLAPGGSLLIETSEQQAAVLAAGMAGSGLGAQPVSEPDLGATVVIGTRPLSRG